MFSALPIPHIARTCYSATRGSFAVCTRLYATRPAPPPAGSVGGLDRSSPNSPPPQPSSREAGSHSKAQSLASRDAELLARLEERSGDGGAAGLELENGEPVAMKRGVKANMFRYI